MAQDRRTFDLSLVTPEGPAFEGEVEMLIVPGAAGEIGILARHAPLVATLKAGSTRVHIRREEEIREFATGAGFFKVEQDRALALVDDAVDAREIDPQRAQEQLEEAQAELERIERGESDADRWQRRAADRPRPEPARRLRRRRRWADSACRARCWLN